MTAAPFRLISARVDASFRDRDFRSAVGAPQGRRHTAASITQGVTRLYSTTTSRLYYTTCYRHHLNELAAPARPCRPRRLADAIPSLRTAGRPMTRRVSAARPTVTPTTYQTA